MTLPNATLGRISMMAFLWHCESIDVVPPRLAPPQAEHILLAPPYLKILRIQTPFQWIRSTALLERDLRVQLM